MNAICPGLILTALTQAQVEGDLDPAALCPMARAGQPQEARAFRCSGNRGNELWRCAVTTKSLVDMRASIFVSGSRMAAFPHFPKLETASDAMLEPANILLTDKVAVVTGGAQGIGEGIARNFARFGAKVVIADKNAEIGRRTTAEIVAAGGEALFVECDVRELPQVEELIKQALSAFGRVDILVNNAGGVRRAPFLDLQERGWRRHVELNLYGLFGPTDLAVRAMIEGGRGGSIINVASIEAFRGAPQRSVYAACKAAMVNFTRTLALELADHGIRVNGIAPDMVATPGIRLVDAEGQAPPERLQALRRAIPQGRVGTIDDTAGTCIFLASELAKYVTGVTIPVDGGTWASSGWTRDTEGRWQLFEGFAEAY